MSNSNYLFIEDSYEVNKNSLHRFINQIGDNVKFDDNIWTCNRKKRDESQKPANYTLYFNPVPQPYIEIIKYYSLIRIKNNKSLKTVIKDIQLISTFFDFILSQYGEIKLININNSISYYYKQYLDNRYENEGTKSVIWQCVNTFFLTMIGWEGFPNINPIMPNPFIKERKFDDKLISDAIADKLDYIFKNERIPLYQRVIYWILRTIPSRIGAVCNMKINCIKPFDGHYVIFIPSNKEGDGYKDHYLNSIHIEYEGTGKYLIDLIMEQQVISKELQDFTSVKNLLFTYHVSKFNGRRFNKTGEILYNKTKIVDTASPISVDKFLEKICRVFDVRDENGELYLINSHQFRHNGITDRLEAGFTPEQIRFMTGQYGDAIIMDSYNHINLRPKSIQNIQNKVIMKNNNDNTPIYFRGRILNMEENVANRILRNLRAHKVRGGICSDITNCNNKIFACLECDLFIDDAEELPYFEEQVTLWKQKMFNFKQYPLMLKVAKYNYELHLKHLNNIKSITKGDTLIEETT